MTVAKTKRLDLTKVESADAPFILELLNTPGWLKYIGDKGIRTIQDAANYIEHRLTSSYRQNGFGLYKMVVKDESKAVGLCGLVQRPYFKFPDIGFAILPQYERCGYTYEASQTIFKLSLSRWGFSTILAITNSENRKSQSLLNKLGLENVGRIKSDPDTKFLLVFSSMPNAT